MCGFPSHNIPLVVWLFYNHTKPVFYVKETSDDTFFVPQWWKKSKLSAMAQLDFNLYVIEHDFF